MLTLKTKTLIDRRYEIVRLIGSGGMGAVYEAVHTRLGMRVALKQMTVSGEKLEQAFAHEALLLATLKHPNLPKVFDYFSDPQGQFLVMEYIPGDDLREVLQRRDTPFPVDEVLRWADQLLQVLDYLHTQADPIIHRDIKPANIKVVDGMVKLLDFGLTKGTPDFLTRHQLSSVTGYTIKYAPPEQISGETTDARSDLFSLAATLYCLLTRRDPVAVPTRLISIHRVGSDPLRPLPEISRNIPQQVSDAVMQALALKTEDRPATAARMRQALRDAYPALWQAGGNGAGTQQSIDNAASNQGVQGIVYGNVIYNYDVKPPPVDPAAEEAPQREAEEARQREAEEAQQRAAEEAPQREAEEARQREAEEAQQRAAEEAQQREAEEVQQRAAEEAQQREAEAARQRAAEEAKQREAEAARQRAADEAKQHEEAKRQRAADEAKQHEEAKRQRAAEEAKWREQRAARQRPARPTPAPIAPTPPTPVPQPNSGDAQWGARQVTPTPAPTPAAPASASKQGGGNIQLLFIAGGTFAVVMLLMLFFNAQARLAAEEQAATATAQARQAAAATTEAQFASTQVLAVEIAPGTTMEFVEVPAGTFLMGSPDDDPDAGFYEKPQHELYLDTFAIGKNEVTNAQFRPFVGGDGYTNPNYWTADGWAWREETNRTAPSYWNDATWNGDTQPVVGVTWYEAMAYAAWLSAQTGGDYRLPSEAEWEKAACGTDTRRYPWGDELPDGERANFDKQIGGTTPVGSFPAGDSPYGALDMSGNVWEWTRSVYCTDLSNCDATSFAYPYNPDDGRESSDNTSQKAFTLRSGSWYNDSTYMNCGERGSSHPNKWDDDIGLRVVCAPCLR